MEPWLVIVDPQNIFTRPDSQWYANFFPHSIPAIQRLADHFGDQTIITRWIPAEEHIGSWKGYFEKWTFADQPADSPIFDLVPEAANWGNLVLDLPTFGKWGPELEAITGPTPTLILAGVATDCCVISTALAAADAGARIWVAPDACSGSNGINHEAALHLMRLYSPQIDLANSEELIKRFS